VYVILEVHRTQEYSHQSFQMSFFSLDISEQKPRTNKQTKETARKLKQTKKKEDVAEMGPFQLKNLKERKKSVF